MFSEGILLSNFISWKALYRAREINLGNLLDDDSFINLQYTRSFSTTSEGSDFKQHLSLEKEMATHSSILAWRATVHRVSKSQTRLIDFTFTFSYSFALWFITGYWIQFPVLHSRTLLFILPICNSLYLLWIGLFKAIIGTFSSKYLHLKITLTLCILPFV